MYKITAWLRDEEGYKNVQYNISAKDAEGAVLNFRRTLGSAAYIQIGNRYYFPNAILWFVVEKVR